MRLSKLEQLYDDAYKSDIHIYDYHFSNSKKASCVCLAGYKTITLDKPAIKSQSEEIVLLAEEIGHYATGSLYSIGATANSPLAKSNRDRCEERARRWKIEKLLPFEEMQKALQKSHSWYELAGYFESPQELVMEAYKYYTEVRGLKFDVNNDLTEPPAQAGGRSNSQTPRRLSSKRPSR
ncbi:MAG: hypothetical protein FWC60_05745 [Firmicutes bacterium]|nr:hypothetical protein [Bacillota bacterium]